MIILLLCNRMLSSAHKFSRAILGHKCRWTLSLFSKKFVCFVYNRTMKDNRKNKLKVITHTIDRPGDEHNVDNCCQKRRKHCVEIRLIIFNNRSKVVRSFSTKLYFSESYYSPFSQCFFYTYSYLFPFRIFVWLN